MPGTHPAQTVPDPSRWVCRPNIPPPPRLAPPNPAAHWAAVHGHPRDARRHVPTTPCRPTSPTSAPRPRPRAPEPFGASYRHPPTPQAALTTAHRPLARPPTAPAQTAEWACRRPTRPGSLHRSPHAPQLLPVVAPHPHTHSPAVFLPRTHPTASRQPHAAPPPRWRGKTGPAPPRTNLPFATMRWRHSDGPRHCGTYGSDHGHPGLTALTTGGSRDPTAQPPTGTAPSRQAGTCTVGAHDEDDSLCATPPSATDAYTQLDGQRFSDPQDSQGRPRTSDAAVARPPHPAHGAPSPLAKAALRPDLRSQRRRGGEVTYTDGEMTAARGAGRRYGASLGR